MENLTLAIVSTVAGLWNVLHEKVESIRQGVIFFLLGFGFCYFVATGAEAYGLDSKISTALGYMCGMFSPSIYRMVVKLLDKIPDLIEKKVTK